MKLVAWLSFVAVVLLSIAQYFSITKLEEIKHFSEARYFDNGLKPFSCAVPDVVECKDLDDEGEVSVVVSGKVVAQYKISPQFKTFRIVGELDGGK